MADPDDNRGILNSNFLYYPLAVFIAVALITCHNQCRSPKITNKSLADTTVYTKIDFTSIHVDSSSINQYLKQKSIHPEIIESVHQFYDRRQFQAAWYNESGLSDAVYNFLNLIQDFQSQIGDPGVSTYALTQKIDSFYLLDKIHRLDSKMVLNLEIELTIAFFKYARRAYQGIGKDPRDLEWYIPRKKKDFRLMLDAIVAGNKELSHLEPVNTFYRNLKSQLIRIQANARKSDSIASEISLIQCSDSLSERDSSIWLDYLLLQGDLITSFESNQNWKDRVAKGLVSYQSRHGLVRTGKPDPATMSTILLPTQYYLHKILINMERLRWMPESGFQDMILVNIPEFRLQVYVDSSQLWSCKVVVGDAAHRTQIFSGNINEIVFNPYWMVPSSIVINEMLPKLKTDPRYLKKNNLELLSGKRVINADEINWKRYHDEVPFQIRQKPGPDNSLGQVKFLFPNSFSIYLHDTPAKELFSENRRDFSHGCIRVAEPLRLAEFILRRDGNPLASKVKSLVNQTTEKRIGIKKPIPVIICYLTAWVDQNGKLHFRKDIYGLDQKLAREIMPSTLSLNH